MLCIQGKKKLININKLGGLSRDWAGGKILLVCFGGSFLWARKTHKQNPPKTPGQSRESFVYVFCCSFVVFFFTPDAFASLRLSGVWHTDWGFPNQYGGITTEDILCLQQIRVSKK